MKQGKKAEAEAEIRGLLNVRQFARAKKRDPFSVYRGIWSGKIKAMKTNRGRYLIPASQLQD